MKTKDELNELESQDIEIQCLLLSMYLKYGYDFREYSIVHIKRRVLHLLKLSGMETISQLNNALLYNKSFFEEKVLPIFSVNVTEMFRDTMFFKLLREEVLPKLSVNNNIKIWIAGCATGEEVYSLAILLLESGLYDKTQIYATDFNEKVLSKAREGKMSLEDVKEHTKRYQLAGGTRSFYDYYTVVDRYAQINKHLLSHVVFASHNLVSDGVFGEMNMVMCRNVLIYFQPTLQQRAIGLFSDSLAFGGFLCLGSKESIRGEQNNTFIPVWENERIYCKINGGA